MNKERLYYVDWLRVIVILCLVPYHASLTFSGLGDIYIKTPIKDMGILPFLAISTPLDNFFMTLLFFVSGIATYYSMQNRSNSDYIGERVRKVFIPFILGTILICPVQAYFKGLHEGFAGNLFGFLPQFFSGKIVDYLGYAHLWFLFYLFVFSLICLPLFRRLLLNTSKLSKINGYLSKGNRIFIPLVFIVAVETVLRPPFTGKQILIGDWANDIVYLSMFIFGFVFAYDNKLHKRLSGLLKPAAALVILCISAFIYIYYMWTAVGSTEFYLTQIWAFLKGIYECSAIILLLILGAKYLNKKSSLLSYLSKASFTYYLLHLLAVTAFTYLFIRTDMNAYIKYILTVALSYISLFICYELIVRRLFRPVLNKAGALFIHSRGKYGASAVQKPINNL